jgi:hypothetical protein
MNEEFQDDLFSDFFEPKKLARTFDPFTSKLAAIEVTHFLGAHHRKIYDALSTMKDGTFYEIAEVAGMEPAAVWRRLNELEKKDKIRTTGEERLGPTNRLCRVWEAI